MCPHARHHEINALLHAFPGALPPPQSNSHVEMSATVHCHTYLLCSLHTLDKTVTVLSRCAHLSKIVCCEPSPTSTMAGSTVTKI
ncbi:hypothetical protein ACB094_09G112700 [Castanea mollissima]